MRQALIVALLVAFVSPVWGQEAPTGPRIVGGYVTGRGYVDMDGLEKKAYLMGLLEGMFLAPAFGGREENMKWLLDCTKDVGLTDFRRYLFEYIMKRDELMENQSPLKAYRAVRDLCGSRGYGAAH